MIQPVPKKLIQPDSGLVCELFPRGAFGPRVFCYDSRMKGFESQPMVKQSSNLEDGLPQEYKDLTPDQVEELRETLLEAGVVVKKTLDTPRFPK